MRKLSLRKRTSLVNMNNDLLYKDLFSSYLDALFLLDFKGEFIDINDGLAALTEFSKETLLYSHFSNYIHTEDLDLVKGAFTHALRGYERAWNGEEQVTYKAILNGFYDIASLNSVWYEGKVVEVIGTCIDLTEREWVGD